MTILRDFSIMWSLVHILIMFLFLFESRYTRKKTVTLTIFAMVPLILLSLALFIICGPASYLKIMLATLTLPSFVFFWFLSKYRDGRFVFTFCMIDTIVLEIIYITNIIDHYIPTYWFMFIVRLIAYPLIELFIVKKFRFIYRDIQKNVKNGWWIFASIGAMFYLAMTLCMCNPTMITERLEDMPVLIFLFILMPVSYIHIFTTLRQQQRVHAVTQQDNILKLQVANMTSRIEEFTSADEKFRVERHDFRHKMQALSTLAENGQYEEIKKLIMEYNEAIEETQVKRYCKNTVIDAVLSSYLTKGENKQIKVSTSLDFPEDIPCSDTELATVFANAIENATNACEKLDSENRYIEIKVLSSPRFMIQISNSFEGEIILDENGIPVATEEGHGFGTKSIVAFCEKYGAFYNFKTEGNTFILRIAF